jgi:hypothetical protein
MKKIGWEIRFGILLVSVSSILYLIHFVVYKDIGDIFLWLLKGLAFLPISILFVTLIVNRLLIQRGKKISLEKLNLLIGIFFSEVGTTLLEFFSDWDPELDKIKEELIIETDWTNEEFEKVNISLRKHKYEIDFLKVDLQNLRSFLIKKHDFLLRLLENPNTLEHEFFTDVLWAVFHLAEELEGRNNIHITKEIKKIYSMLVFEWVDYMFYLSKNYPYSFSLAMRTNPFDENASIEYS